MIWSGFGRTTLGLLAAIGLVSVTSAATVRAEGEPDYSRSGLYLGLGVGIAMEDRHVLPAGDGTRLSATATLPGEAAKPAPVLPAPAVKTVTPAGDAVLVHAPVAENEPLHDSVAAALFKPTALPSAHDIARGACGGTIKAPAKSANAAPLQIYLHQPQDAKAAAALGQRLGGICCEPGKPCAAFAVALDAAGNPVGAARRAPGSFFYPRGKGHGSAPLVDRVYAEEVDESGLVLGVAPRVPADVAYVVCHADQAGAAPADVRSGRCAQSVRALARGKVRVLEAGRGGEAGATARVDLPIAGFAKHAKLQVVAVPAEVPRADSDACPGAEGFESRCDATVVLDAPFVLRDLTAPRVTDVTVSNVDLTTMKISVTLDEPGTAYFAAVPRPRKDSPAPARVPTFAELRDRTFDGAVQFGAIRATPIGMELQTQREARMHGAIVSAWRALGSFRRRLMSGASQDELSAGSAFVSGLKEGHVHDVYVLAEDEASNHATHRPVTRRILTGSVPPVITLQGTDPITIDSLQNGVYDVENVVYSVYQDPGATASDNVDGDVTSQIVVDNPVNTAIPGLYTVTYTVTDTDGNTAVATRDVIVSLTAGWAPVISGEANQISNDIGGLSADEGRFYKGSCCVWRKKCKMSDILYMCSDTEVSDCNLLPASARDPKCAMCSMCDANGGSPTGQTSIITRANKPETMMDFQREACHPKPVFDPELKTRLGERIGWSSYFDPDVQPYKGPKGSLGVVDQHRRFAANDASTINDIPANPNAPLVQAPKFTVCREIQYTCHEFEDHTTKQCLPLDNPNDLNPTTEDHVAVVRQDIGQKQKHLDEKLHRLFTNFFSRRRRST